MQVGNAALQPVSTNINRPRMVATKLHSDEGTNNSLLSYDLAGY